jgi:hypothetical protein
MVERTTSGLKRTSFHQLGSLILKIAGGCLFVWGSCVILFVLPSGAGILPPGGGWRAVVDAGIKGALAAGLGSILAICGISLYNRGRKMSVSPIREVGDNPRPPVLYLRSFREDVVTAQATSKWIAGLEFWTPTTQEEQVVHVLDVAGPVWAVGKPGEILPELGAARLHFSEDEWRDQVSALMKRSVLTVIRVGTSEGLLWEIETAVGQNRPQHILLLIPFAEKEYELFSQKTGHLFPCGLPPWPSDARGKLRKPAITLDIKAIVYFDASWRGAMFTLTGESLRKSLKTTAQCVYRQLNITPQHPSVLRRSFRAALSTVGLVAALIPGLVLAAASSRVLGSLHEKFYALRIFSKTRTQELTESPNPLSRALGAEIAKNTRVRVWFESATTEDLNEMPSRVAEGLPSLSDELLYQRAHVISTLLDTIDTRTCAALIRRLSATPLPSIESVNGVENMRPNGSGDLLELIKSHLSSAEQEQYASVVVKAIEASLMKAPAQSPTQEEYKRAVREALGLLNDQDRKRMIRSIQHYATLSDEDLCWVERATNAVALRVSPSAHSAIVRRPLGIKP